MRGSARGLSANGGTAGRGWLLVENDDDDVDEDAEVEVEVDDDCDAVDDGVDVEGSGRSTSPGGEWKSEGMGRLGKMGDEGERRGVH